MRIGTVILSSAALAIAGAASIPVAFACGDNEKASAQPVSMQISGGCPVMKQDVSFQAASVEEAPACAFTKAISVANTPDKADCAIACPLSTKANGLQVNAESADVIWAFVNDKGEIVQPDERTRVAISNVVAKLGKQQGLTFQPVTVESGQEKPVVHVKNNLAPKIAEEQHAAVRAFVNNKAELVNPSEEQMNAATARAVPVRRAADDVVPRDANDLSMGYKVIPAMMFLDANINEDGAVKTGCSAACADKHLTAAQAAPTEPQPAID